MRPSTCAGTPEIIALRRRAEPLRPVAAHELVVAADAAGGDDDGLRAAARTRRPRRGCSTARARTRSGASTAPRTPSTAPPLDGQRVDAVAEAQLDEPARGGRAHAALERLDDARPGPPGDVEARDRVAVADRAVAAALGPADVGQQPHALRVQPGRASRRRRSRRRPRPSAAASRPPARSKPAVPSQSCQASSCESLMRIRRCSGESTRNRPPKDQNAWPPSDASGSWSTRSTRRPASASSAVATRPARPAPTTITSASVIGAPPYVR